MMFTGKGLLADRQIINSSILSVVKEDLCYICLGRCGFVENQYCVLMQYWFSENVTDQLDVQLLPGTSAALCIT